ncbi:MAG TPA: TIGR04283 family arsenosugar biosynthesis glycosyltransferase [Thermoanaerobaculia bacterium]|nr:TIGR04283 family arsenosugar biosynthesis glycosyltransferase [Thermoanaerobaculia bacterium]
MTAAVTVIIASRNEEPRIAASVESAFAAGAAEVLLADGASEDATRAIAASRGATVIECPPMRSRQFNTAAAAASHPALVFLHADTTLPPGAAAAVAAALGGGALFGGFRLRFAESTRGLRFTAFMINLRTSITRCPWGDQAQFIGRETFLSEGGFREIPIMEDYELALRMKRRGRSVLLPRCVTTSGRRFLQGGLVRTTVLNWTIIAAWRLGVGAERLARWYGS